MQKYAGLYVKYAEVHFLHILHLYALSTLLMTLPASAGGGSRGLDASPCQELSEESCIAAAH